MDYDELVQRLRDWLPRTDQFEPHCTCNNCTATKAADAITKLRAERDALRDEVGLRRHTMPAQYAKLIAERDTLQKERDHALEMVNVQDNQIDALRALLREAQVWLAQDEELDRRIDAALAAPESSP